MVQVDVVWSYAFGASFAASAAHELRRETKVFDNRCYSFLLVFLGVLFAPSGLYLLFRFPQWETMQVASSLHDIPPWLVTVFAVTNITQGILGYLVGYTLIQRRKFFAAHANWMVAWILFWFILVCGWDTSGWQRFLYDASKQGNVPWAHGMHMGPWFFVSNVWISLLVMAVFFTPALLRGIVVPLVEASTGAGWFSLAHVQALILMGLRTLGTMFILCLAIAIGGSWIVMGIARGTHCLWAGYVLGLPLFVGLAWWGLFRKGMPMHRIAEALFVHQAADA